MLARAEMEYTLREEGKAPSTHTVTVRTKIPDEKDVMRDLAYRFTNQIFHKSANAEHVKVAQAGETSNVD